MLNKNIEILSPVGDFECLKAAVQNGANSVYLGVSDFNARQFATNFDINNLGDAITYAKLRNVKVHLVLNILIKNNEFEKAFEVAKKAYELGVDAIIVQDMGLALTLIKAFPDLPIHASTQMTVHNLEGVKLLEKLGFKRAVLSRELSLNEIEYICKNSNIEIETFIHGALCVSYSGQCLFSSIIGGRSGNRGKCAGTCRLPYELIESGINKPDNQKHFNSASHCEIFNSELANTENVIDKGYLLSTKDLCGLEFLPSLVKAGVICFKIEGRMKTPEYVATVTRIYRKYLDKILNNEDYFIDPNDIKDLKLVFNRGNFSNGFLDEKPNRSLVYKDKPNHIGVYLGKVLKFNSNKGLVTLKLEDNLSIGDKISIDNKGISNNYTVSELILNSNNIKNAKPQEVVTIGRMKGNISVNDKIYLTESKNLTELSTNSYQNVENFQLNVDCSVDILPNEPIRISARIVSENSGSADKFAYNHSSNLADTFAYNYANNMANKFTDNFKDISCDITTNIIPEMAKNAPITIEKITQQFNKTKNTIFKFNSLNINLSDNLFLTISSINELRRLILDGLLNNLVKNIKRNVDSNKIDKISNDIKNTVKKDEPIFNKEKPRISVLLNSLNKNFDYSSLSNISRLYVPLRYFLIPDFKEIINNLNDKFNLYIYMPTIMRNNYINLLNINIKSIFSTYCIKGVVISNIGQLKWFESYDLDIVGNYTLNVLNNISVSELKCLNINSFTLSPELDRDSLISLTASNKNSELIVYGNAPVMNTNYCVLGKTNKCYKECPKYCKQYDKKFFLKDRLNFKFRVIPDNIDTVSTIYNSKTTSIKWKDFNTNNLRIDILDENIDMINTIISKTLNNERFEGKDYTNANLNKEI